MKVFISIFTLVTLSLSVSAQNGYCFSSSTRGSFEDVKATKFDKIKTETEQTNIYSFSFSDNFLVHHIVQESGTVCQFYKITDVEKINSYFGYKAISEIRIHQKKDYKENNNYQLKMKENSSKIDENMIKKDVNGLEDKDLEKSIIKLGVSISKLEK